MKYEVMPFARTRLMAKASVSWRLFALPVKCRWFVGVVIVGFLQAQSLTWLGSLGGNEGAANCVSSNGSVVVGWSRNAAGKARAFRWTSTAGMQDLGTFGGDESYANGVSEDGTLTVGDADLSQNSFVPFYHTASGGNLNTLPGLPSPDGSARAISADGTVIVGYYIQSGTNHWRAFRWSNNSAQDPGTLGGNEAFAEHVSADGSVIVGWSWTAALTPTKHPFIWTAGGAMQSLGTLGGNNGEARGVSPDGTIVVGFAQGSDGREQAFRWTQANGMQGLGFLNPGNLRSRALSVSAQGHVVGWVEVTSGTRRAVRWIGNAIEDLNLTYATLLSPRSYLISAISISPDGRFIVGTGYNGATERQEPFLLFTGTPTFLPAAENSLSWNVQILPDRLLVRWQEDVSAHVEIWSLTGQKIASGDGRGQAYFYMPTLPQGIYVCRIYGANGYSARQKVIIN